MQMKRLPILIALLILTACTVVEAPTPTAAPSPTSTASVTPTATATATASVTPSITASPTATEIQSTPDFLALPISNDPLFAPGPDLDCQLPCWQGLRIGESTDEDIQRVLDETFGFSGTVDFFNDDLSLPPYLIIDAPDIYTTGYIWDLPEVGTGITLLLVTEETTKKLQGIQLTYSPGGAYSVHTPQQIISELGSPDYIYLNVDLTIGYFIHIKSNLIYKAGMHFTHVIDIPIQEGESVGDYCLNAPSRTIRDQIFEPLNELTRENATPVQKKWIFDYLDQVQPKPIDEVFGLTIEEFTEIALRDENPCIEINPDMLPDN